MTEYIDKSTLLRSFAPIYEHDRYTGLTFETAKQIIADHINSLPTIEAEPIKHGRNIATEYDDVDEFICSECGLHLENWVSVEVDEDTGEKTYHEFRLRRCPCCGAKMDERGNER